MALRCVAFLFLGLVCDAARYKTSATGATVMKPPGIYGRKVGVVMVPGGGVKPDLYKEHLRAWQDEAARKGISLWVAITSYLGDLPLPRQVKANFNSALLAMRGNGLPWDADIFYAGHSMGGSASQGAQMDLYKEGKFRGVILMASYITRAFFPPLSGDKMTYTVPTLTIGAELDSTSARLTRIAEAMYRQASMKKTHPVVVIEGMNHMQFATGYRKKDLKPEKTEAAAQAEVARVAADFMAQVIGVGSGGLVAKSARATRALLKPVVDAFELEGARGFNVPNQLGGTPKVKCPGGLCKDGSPIVNQSQRYVIGDRLMQSAGVTLKNNYGEILPFKPSIAGVRGSIKIQSYAMAPVNTLLYQNDIQVPVSSEQLFAKMVSRQALADHLGEKIEKDGDFCREFNQKIYDDALANAGAKARFRFNKYGQPMVFVKSNYRSAGPLWFYNGIKYREVGGKMEVTSNALLTAPGPSDFDGKHYCKLLSPARATEWIYVDGLKSKLLGIWN